MATRRLGLLIFGVAFVVLFAIVAIAEGLGDPSIPSDDIILVEEAVGDSGEVTEVDFKRALDQAAAAAGQKKAPKPGSAKYEELKETALGSVLEPIWLEGLGAEMGITVSDKEVVAEREKLKKENFKTEAEFKEFLKQSRYTLEDVNQRVKLQKVSTEIQEQLKEQVPAPSKSEIEGYYEAAKASQFTQKASRDVRVIVNKDQEKAEEAQKALTKDNTAENWEKVAKKYSEDPATKSKGGLRKAVAEGSNEEPLDKEIFSTPEDQVEGPIKTQQGYTVFEVEDSTPESIQELKAVESQIQSTLAQRGEQEYFNSFVANFTEEWRSRTFCASGYETERCANFTSDGHPSTAPPACYEADPKGGLPEACPAPVFQAIPAVPGSVTPLEPQGKPLAQRPVPVGEEKEGAEAPTGLPPGAVPPTEAPSE